MREASPPSALSSFSASTPLKRAACRSSASATADVPTPSAASDRSSSASMVARRPAMSAPPEKAAPTAPNAAVAGPSVRESPSKLAVMRRTASVA